MTSKIRGVPTVPLHGTNGAVEMPALGFGVWQVTDEEATPPRWCCAGTYRPATSSSRSR